MPRRLPAEWEEQDGVLIAWPHGKTDWAPELDRVEPVFAEIVKHIVRFEQVVLLVPDRDSVARQLAAGGAPSERIAFFPIPTDDTWSRDFGPITIYENDAPALLDFGFNGWGLKFPSANDNQATRRLLQAGALRSVAHRVMGMILEGGSIESDGRGTLLTTAACLLGPNRNPHLDRGEIESELSAQLGASRVQWLHHGALEGDDTDAHVDTLARFAPNDTILYVACDNPADSHFLPLGEMARELADLRTLEGNPYRLLPLPWPEPKFGAEGNRLPATYANFLVINGAVLVPTYGDGKDPLALEVIGKAFPGREIVGIDCLPLVAQHGSLHCVTMQLPKGVLE